MKKIYVCMMAVFFLMNTLTGCRPCYFFRYSAGLMSMILRNFWWK